MTAPINCQLIGRWRIVEADLWDTTDHWKSSSHTISATRPSSKPFAPLLQQPARGVRRRQRRLPPRTRCTVLTPVPSVLRI